MSVSTDACGPSRPRLESWKAVAAHFGRDVTTVRRWERREGLPIHRLVHAKLGSIYAYPDELDAWWRARDAGTPSAQPTASTEAEAAYPRARETQGRDAVVDADTSGRESSRPNGLTPHRTPSAASFVDAPSPAARGTRRLPSAALLSVAAAIATLVVWLVASGDPRGAEEARARSMEADQAYARGLQLARQRELTAAKRAVDEFRRALALRPDFALAYAGLAETASMIHPREPAISLDLATRAVRLDPDCGACLATLGYLQFSKAWKWRDAAAALDRAVTLAPDDAQIQYWHAQLQAIQGRPREALRSIDAAIARLPDALTLHVLRAACLYFLRDYDGALRAADTAIAVNLLPAWDWRSRALLATGRHQEGIRTLMWSLGAWNGRSTDATATRAQAMLARLAADSLRGPLQQLLDETAGAETRPIHAYNRASWEMRLGRPDAALRELDAGLARQSFDMVYVAVDPLFAPLHDDPRFRRVLTQMDLSVAPAAAQALSRDLASAR